MWQQTVGFDTPSSRAIAVTVRPRSASSRTRLLVVLRLSSDTPLGNGVIGSTRHSGCRSWGSSPCSPVPEHDIDTTSPAGSKAPFCGAFSLLVGNDCYGLGGWCLVASDAGSAVAPDAAWGCCSQRHSEHH